MSTEIKRIKIGVNKASSVGLSVISFYFWITISYQLMFNEGVAAVKV